MQLTRRQFLTSTAVVTAGSVLLPAVFRRAGVAALVDPPAGEDAKKRTRTLVVVQMAGGNDGLNTVVPYKESLYQSYRPGLALQQNEVIPLTDDISLHGSMTKFKELWDAGLLAVVQGVGYPSPTFSHFSAMDIWQTADPTLKLRTGWLGRYLEKLDRKSAAAFEGMAVGGVLPKEFQSSIPLPLIESVNAYRIQTDGLTADRSSRRIKALTTLYSSFPKDIPYSLLLDGTMSSMVESTTKLQTANAAYRPGVTYPNNSLAAGLRLIATAIDAGLGVRVAHISLGGFDTHSAQRGTQQRLLQQLADAIAAFYSDLREHGRDEDVVVMTWSEFGRRAKGNGSAGTDHGSAGPMFIVGAKVQGGVYGERPSLSNLDADNLRFTTDFRSVYATVLQEWMGTSPDVSLGTTAFAPLKMIGSAPNPLRPLPRPIVPGMATSTPMTATPAPR
ncbi:MAG: DUF1501 domain-containing protein [Chloroflexi bacterium]|nr:DUF1501 domain-containing protein [Chloroflexota bacterium]